LGSPHRPTEDFFVGVNLPWLTYGCDFGANAWQPGGGVGQAERQLRLDEIFARLSRANLRTVRWFVLCDGRCGIEFDEGVPRGLDRFLRRDFDAALSAAARHRLSLIPVLFDFLWCARGRRVNGVVIGGRRGVLASRSARQALLDRVVRPLLQPYGREPLIDAWDLFNEPEWATLGYGGLNPLAAVRPATMRSTLAELAAAARSEVVQRLTVGLASPRGIGLVNGAALDELQVHWYDRRAAAVYRVEEAQVPVVLGEFPTRGSASPPEAILSAARAHGYRGALGWSAAADDPYSDLGALEGAASRYRG
jgi:hypothetical protein